MRNANIILFVKSTTLTLLILCLISCNNTTTTDESKLSNSADIALVDSNIETTPKMTLPDLYYGVDTRFAAVKKSDIDKETTIYAFLNEGEKQQIAQVNSVDLIIIKNNQHSNIREYGESENLTDRQLKLLKSTDYFSHFKLKTIFKEKNTKNSKLEEHWFGPYITVVPEKQAKYVDGKEALLTYLKENSIDDMNIITNKKLGAIKISFIVTKEGNVSNVIHDVMTTGYASIDQKLIELVKNIPGHWIPAENSNGEKMDYEFVFTFGPRDGC